MRQIATRIKVSKSALALRPMIELPEVQLFLVADLNPPRRNTRTHSKKQIEQIVNSIRRFGWTYPIIIDAHDNILCGAGRWLAAQQLGLLKVPVFVLHNLVPSQLDLMRSRQAAHALRAYDLPPHEGHQFDLD